jgi:TusA-related sulfurtransferase
MSGEPARVVLDLRGVPCPLSWARARVRLEALAGGTEVEILLDEARGARDLPRAAEAAGHHVVGVDDAGGTWRVLIEV